MVELTEMKNKRNYRRKKIKFGVANRNKKNYFK